MRFVAALTVLAALVTTAATADAGPAKKKKRQAAVVLVIDRSGSMQGPKLEAAKQAAVVAASSLKKTDQIAVVTFDSAVAVPVPPQKAGDGKALATGIATITSGGGTNMIVGVAKAYELLKLSKAKVRHVIVLSDGESPYDQLQETVTAMHADGITLSTVAVAGADRNLMTLLSSAGGGNFYWVDDLAKLSEVFADETKAAIK